MADNKLVHFPGLNGLRTIAALTVIVLHVNQMLPILFKQEKLLPETDIAKLSVILFFVLSGFLITYLLLEEKKVYNTISLKSFYLKRMLRIWPPYYLTLLLALLLFPLYKWVPQNPTNNTLLVKGGLLFFFMLPNVSAVLNLMLTPLRAMWSIGAEEQFYVIWPVIIKRSTKTFIAIAAFIAIFFAAKTSFFLLQNKSAIFSFLFKIFQNTPIHIMAFGALGAIWFRKKSKILNFIYHPVIQYVTIAIWVLTYFINISIPLIKSELYAVVFLIIILNVSTNSKSVIKLEGAFFNYFGKISYGLYVYHMLIVVIASIVLNGVKINSWVLLVLLISAIILFSSASYFYYERWFLKLKSKLATIKSAA